MSYVIFILKSIAFVFAFRAITLIFSTATEKMVTPDSKLLINGVLLFYTILYNFFAAIWVSWMNNFESGINWKLAITFIFLTTAFWVVRAEDSLNKNSRGGIYQDEDGTVKAAKSPGLHNITTGVLLLSLIAFSIFPNLPNIIYQNIPNQIISSLFPIF